MVYSFYEFITESKDYPLYKGVNTTNMGKIVDSGFIKTTDTFQSELRKLVAKGRCISATRNKNYGFNVGSWIIIFDTKKLTSSFKVIPFCENPDYYLDIIDNGDGDIEPISDSIFKMIRLRKYNKDFWKVKTDKTHMDFDICEELIISEKIDIKKYIKKVIYMPNNKFDYWNTHEYITNERIILKIKNKLDKLGIQNNIIIK